MKNLFKRSDKDDPGPEEDPSNGFAGLKAAFLNGTLKPSPQVSHTEGLMQVAAGYMRGQGVEVVEHRLVDYDIAPGVYPDMTQHGFKKDDWPEIYKDVAAAHILVVGSPIWLGQYSSEVAKLIERLYAHSGQTNDKGQYFYYGKVGGCIVTGNEDGVKHVAMEVLYALQHVGYTIPPQADAGWIGEAGPGPSYLDDGSGGPQNDFTQRNTAFMAWNLMHMAKLLRDSGGLPDIGNVRADWDCHKGADWPNPEHR